MLNLFFNVDYNQNATIATATLRLHRLPRENQTTSSWNSDICPDNTIFEEEKLLRVSIYWYVRSSKKHSKGKFANYPVRIPLHPVISLGNENLTRPLSSVRSIDVRSRFFILHLIVSHDLIRGSHYAVYSSKRNEKVVKRRLALAFHSLFALANDSYGYARREIELLPCRYFLFVIRRISLKIYNKSATFFTLKAGQIYPGIKYTGDFLIRLVYTERRKRNENIDRHYSIPIDSSAGQICPGVILIRRLYLDRLK